MCDEIHQDFQRLLCILKPDITMMMEAYFDESGTHDGSPVMCVAGYLFTVEQAVHFDREWAMALVDFGVSHFHAHDCAQGIKEFAILSPRERTELTIRLIGIIKRRMTIGIAISISETDFGKVPAPNWARGGPYMLGAMMALAGVVAWADRRSFGGKISYFFESGHKHQAQTHAAFDELQKHASEALHFNSVTFAGKRVVRALQAADILAYEWHKELKRINEPPIKRSMRRSLESLLEQRHITQHYGAEHLNLMFTQGFRALGTYPQVFNDVE